MGYQPHQEDVEGDVDNTLDKNTADGNGSISVCKEAVVEYTILAEKGFVYCEGDDTDTCYGKSADALRRAPLVLITSPAAHLKSITAADGLFRMTYQMIAIIKGKMETMNKNAPIQSKWYICWAKVLSPGCGTLGRGLYSKKMRTAPTAISLFSRHNWSIQAMRDLKISTHPPDMYMLNLHALGPLFAMNAPPARSARIPPTLTAEYKHPAVRPRILRGNTSAARRNWRLDSAACTA